MAFALEDASCLSKCLEECDWSIDSLKNTLLKYSQLRVPEGRGMAAFNHVVYIRRKFPRIYAFLTQFVFRKSFPSFVNPSVSMAALYKK